MMMSGRKRPTQPNYSATGQIICYNGIHYVYHITEVFTSWYGKAYRFVPAFRLAAPQLLDQALVNFGGLITKIYQSRGNNLYIRDPSYVPPVSRQP